MIKQIFKTKRWLVVFPVLLGVVSLFAIGFNKIIIDTNVVNSLPQDDAIIKSAQNIFKNHPMQNRLVVNVGVDKPALNDLTAVTADVAKAMHDSKLFTAIGLKKMQSAFPILLQHVLGNLPLLFSAEDLQKNLKPKLTAKHIQSAMQQHLKTISGMQGIGMSGMIEKDPLGFSGLILKKLAALRPGKGASIVQDYLLSKDQKNMLIVAVPDAQSTDTGFARKATKLFAAIQTNIQKKYKAKKLTVTLTPVGAFRAALDNETTAKADSERAILIATIGIAILLLLVFPRPYLGLLALVPAVAGSMLALFFFSLFHSDISILALGFGGGIISITVDHAIVYILFLDRPHDSSGKKAAHEVWSVGLLAGLTTIGAFLSLSISGFPILVQIGQFAALGILFSFIFVHTVFPLMFPELKGVKTNRTMYVQTFIQKVTMSKSKKPLIIAAVVFVAMLFLAKPNFHIDLSSMNSVSDKTVKAEKMITDTWGGVFNKIFIKLDAKTYAELAQQTTRLTSRLKKAQQKKQIGNFFSSAEIFPSSAKQKQNYAAWKKFWTKQRLVKLQKTMAVHAAAFGFDPAAFGQFYKNIISPIAIKDVKIAKELFDLLGISQNAKTKKWQQFLTVYPGKNYDARQFYHSMSAKHIEVFDGSLFSSHLGEILGNTFIRMILIIGASVVIILMLSFLSFRLTGIALMPIVFALVVTLGFLKILGRPLDIPALMLSIIVLGMGIDYSLYLVRSYQRYQQDDNSSLTIIRLGVFLASMSTIIGFGVLAFSNHNILKSAGLVCLLGISFSLLGSFVILPPILQQYFKPVVLPAVAFTANSKAHIKRILKRYSKCSAHARMFARFKLKLDPMFTELATFLKKPPKKIMDIGTGSGVPMMWLLELYPEAKLFGIEPLEARVRVARQVMRQRAEITLGQAPDLPEVSGKVDLITMLDVGHYLSDAEMLLLLKRMKSKLTAAGTIIIRITVPMLKHKRFYRLIELLNMKISKCQPYYRQQKELKKIIKASGLKIKMSRKNTDNREEVWFILQK